mgnify:CR=1 FL=1
MTENVTPFNPDYTVHHGEYRAEILQSRGIKKREFTKCRAEGFKSFDLREPEKGLFGIFCRKKY